MAENIRTGLRTRYIPTGEATPDASALGAMIAPRDPQLADVQNIVDTEGSAQRGFRQGLRGTLGMSEAYLANALEAAGRKQAADALYAAAQDQLQQGAMVAPRVTDYRDVGNVSDAWDYAAGMAGQGVASTLPTALAIGLAKRPIAQYLAGAGAMLPQQAGENVLRLRDDPVAMQNMTAAERFGLSTLTGGAQAVAEAAVPFLVSKRLGLRTTPAARNMARDVLGGAGVEGLTEGVQERMGQTAHSYANPNRDTSGDAPDIVNAVLGGAAGGGAMVAPGAMIAHGLDVGKAGADKGYAIGKKAAELGAQGLEVAKDKAVDLGDAAAEKAEPVMAAIRGQAGKAMDQAKVQWLAGKDSLPDDIASDPEAVMKHLAEQDSQRKSVVADYLNGVANDESAHPERRAQAADMLGKLDDPETFRMAANVVVGMEKVKGHAQRVNELLADAADFGKGFLGKKKQNAQAADDLSKLAPADRLITQHLLDGLEPEAVEAGADKLVPIFRGMFNGKLPPQLQHRALRDFIGIYGDSAPEIASKIAVNIQRDDEGRGMDPDATRKAFQELMATDESRMDTRHEAVRSALTNEVKDRIQQELGRQANDSDVRAITGLMTKLVDGSLSEKSAPAVESELKSMLGDRYKHTLNVFRAIHESEAWKESPLFNDSNEYEDQMESKSFGTMLEGVNRRWSLANKTDESGIAPMFDSREEAQKRWDENIAPKYPGYEGRVVTGDQYAVINGTDPLALAAQYDGKFKTVPSDYKAKAQHLKDAMALLRTKHVVQMDMVSNDDTDVLSDKELRQVLAKSALPVERTEEGKAPIRNTKPPVSAGYIFVHVGSRVRPIKMSALEYVVRGKQQKEAFGGTGDKHEGSHDAVRAVMTGLARLADSGSLNIEAGVFGYDQRGGKHWIIAPKGERANMKAVEALKVGQTTLGKLMEESRAERKEGSQKERQRGRNMLLTKKIEESDHLKEDIRVAAAEANDAIENGTDEEQQAAIKSLQELKKERGALWDDDITERDVTDKLMASEQRTAAENAEERDNGELNEIEKLNAGRQDDEVKSAAAEIAKRSNIQKTSVGNTSDKLAKQIEAKLAEQSAEIAPKANSTFNMLVGAMDYMNGASVDPKLVGEISDWVDKQYARTNDPDTISLLNDLKKLVGQQAPRKKSNAMSADIHNDLGKEGFGATHDSPIRHEGKFNWREHSGKGEGNAAFGAGTYLSTANGVHKMYKKQFTADLPGARYFTWGSDVFEYDPDTGDIFKNGELAKAGTGHYEIAHAMLAYGLHPKEALEQAKDQIYSIVDRSGSDIADLISVSEFDVPNSALHYLLNALRERKHIDEDKVHTALKPFLSVERWNKALDRANRLAAALENIDVAELKRPLSATSPTYHVTVNAKPEELLDWDAPLSAQSEKVQNALRGLKEAAPAVVRDIVSGDIVESVELSGETIYKNIAKKLGSQYKASDYLQSLGIVGHKYNSEGGRNSKFPNYVIYDDSRIETNYVSFNKEQAEAAKEALSSIIRDELVLTTRSARHAIPPSVVKEIASRSKGDSVMTLREVFDRLDGVDMTTDQRKLINYMQLTPIPDDVRVSMGKYDKKRHGQYAREVHDGGIVDRSITLSPTKDGMSIDTLVHEAAHSMTVMAFLNPEPVQFPFGEFFDRITAYLSKKVDRAVIWSKVGAVEWADSQYAFSKSEEMIAEFFGNPYFRETLAKIVPKESEAMEIMEAAISTVMTSRMIMNGLRGMDDAESHSDAEAYTTKWIDKVFGREKKTGEGFGSIIAGMISEMVTAPVRADGTYNYNTQKVGKVATDAEVQEAKDYIHKVLGRKIKAEFVDSLGGISGEWEEGATENIVRVALNAGPGVLSVAHHEAMHEFFDRLTKRGAKDVAQALVNVANSPMVRKRLEVLLRNEPEALKQIRNDQEERLAYMYQFWAAKRLEVGPKATSVFEKIKAFFRKITGMLNESERAENVLRAFHNGDLSKLSGFGKAVQAVANQDNALTKGYKKLAPLAKRAQELVYTSEGVLTSHDNATLDKLAAMFNTGANSTSRGQGYLNAKAQEMNRWLNRFNSAIEGLEREELDAIRDALRTETMPTTAHLRAPAREIRTILDDFYKYATAAGVPLKQLRNYFPQVWDSNEIMARSDEFKELLLKHHSDILEKIADTGNKKRIAVLEKQIKKADPAHAAQMTELLEEMKANPHTAEDVADTITQRLLAGNGVSAPSEGEDRIGYTPLMSAVNSRSLNFIDKEVFADFFEKDTVRIMSNYLSQGVHRAEYARRFGNEGAVIADMLDKAFDEEVAKHRAKGDDPTAAMTKATATIESAKRAVMAMEGTLGHDISPTMRKWSSYMMAYQNLRILPMALFSSLIDPMGLAVRGGTLNDSLEGLRRGVKEIANSIKGEHSTDEMTKLAEAIGTVDNAMFMDALGETYNSIYMTGWAKKLNDKMFQWNGMEAWNRGMRVAATQAAIEFIKRNVENPGPHSQRWLEELGLAKDDVVITNGKLEVLEGPNLNAIQAHRTQAAIQRWVDSAVLRPNAAQRPPWASDPHYALLFHMKQFTYSFQKTILARVTNEWREGNLMPALALAWYVPFMIAADMAKAVLQGMGDEPDYMKGWTVQDYMARGIQRAGLLGVGQFGMDAYNMGAESILGPTAEQAVDALKDPIDKTAIDALPVNPLYKNALK